MDQDHDVLVLDLDRPGRERYGVGEVLEDRSLNTGETTPAITAFFAAILARLPLGSEAWLADCPPSAGGRAASVPMTGDAYAWALIHVLELSETHGLYVFDATLGRIIEPVT